MKKSNLKIFVGIITFIIGIFAVAMFTYHIFIAENTSDQVIQPIEVKQSEESVNQDEKVYLAVLNELFVKDNHKTLVISNKTSSYDNEYLKETSVEQRIQDMKKYYDSAADDTLGDYEAKTHKSLNLNFNIKLPIKYVFIYKENVSEGKEGGIIAFSKKYPDARGMIEFSAVGFNKEKTQAVVSVDFIYCPLCGFGNSIILEKIDGKWKIVENYRGWVS